jgi:hypothetical protein
MRWYERWFGVEPPSPWLLPAIVIGFIAVVALVVLLP